MKQVADYLDIDMVSKIGDLPTWKLHDGYVGSGYLGPDILYSSGICTLRVVEIQSHCANLSMVTLSTMAPVASCSQCSVPFEFSIEVKIITHGNMDCF